MAQFNIGLTNTRSLEVEQAADFFPSRKQVMMQGFTRSGAHPQVDNVAQSVGNFSFGGGGGGGATGTNSALCGGKVRVDELVQSELEELGRRIVRHVCRTTIQGVFWNASRIL